MAIAPDVAARVVDTRKSLRLFESMRELYAPPGEVRDRLVYRTGAYRNSSQQQRPL
jgi:hypothetical protein